MQKEREQEKGQFADKEAFVTSAYKKKMEEMQKEEEQERREAEMEGKFFFFTKTDNYHQSNTCILCFWQS